MTIFSEATLKPTRNYDEAVHRHRFAAWCASTAAKSSPNCRFSVERGVRLIESCGLQELSEAWGNVPTAETFDHRHRIWREHLIAAAPDIIGSGKRRRFTAGVAAKLINCYLKPLYITGVIDDIPQERRSLRDAMHPPIDRILLQTLAAENVGSMRLEWKRFADIGWSNFSHEQYQQVIEMVRAVTKGQLWTIEEHWGGHRV
jgi:hypothetical protein